MVCWRPRTGDGDGDGDGDIDGDGDGDDRKLTQSEQWWPTWLKRREPGWQSWKMANVSIQMFSF